ncbi:MAG: hypothetical protein KY455_10935 [Euryarchaeota archaeon]|nr:hypothetical protein [Euryarchaeota archaeon]
MVEMSRKALLVLWGKRAGSALLLGIALSFVVLVTYLPHMDTSEGRVNFSGAIENPSTEEPWSRFYGAYAGWANGTRDDYEYPMHVDSNVHWTRMAALQREDTLQYRDPYSWQERGELTLSLKGQIHESGFHIAFAQFQEITGVPFLQLIRFAPALFAALSAWLVWAALRPWPGAPLAAAFVALVPTTPRFLGPGFFVPIGIGLAWLAVALVVAPHVRRDGKTLLLASLLGVWAFFIHLIIGFAFLLALIMVMLPGVREGRAQVPLLLGGLLVPFLVLYDGFAPDIEAEAEVVNFLPIDFTVFDQLGVPYLVLWVIGCSLVFLLPVRNAARTPLIGATLTSVVMMAFIVSNLVFDLDRYALYDRWHQPFALMSAVPVAYGILGGLSLVGAFVLFLRDLYQEKRWAMPADRLKSVLVFWGVVLTPLLAVAVVTDGVERHLNEPYYRILDDEDWVMFWGARDLGPEYEVFLSHPWKAPVYNALTGMRPYSWLDPGYPPNNQAAWIEYQREKHADPVWLFERDLAVIFQQPAPPGEWYEPLPAGGWVVDKDTARALFSSG